MPSPKPIIFAFIFLPFLVACELGVPENALQLTPDSLHQRQMQTRVFGTENEAELLSASAALLQDLGFNLDRSETGLGLIVASKDRDAREAGQIVLAILLVALTGETVPIDFKQEIRASVATRKLRNRDGYAVRLTMQRLVFDTDGNVSTMEALDRPDIYQEFFSKLSKSVFLEAQEI